MIHIECSFELPSNSAWLLVERWLVFIHERLPRSVSLRYIRGGRVECLNEEHSISVHWVLNSIWHAKRCQNEFGSQCTKRRCSVFKSKQYLQICITSGKKIMILYTKQPKNIKGDQLPTKSATELQDIYNNQLKWNTWSIQSGKFVKTSIKRLEQLTFSRPIEKNLASNLQT